MQSRFRTAGPSRRISLAKDAERRVRCTSPFPLMFAASAGASAGEPPHRRRDTQTSGHAHQPGAHGRRGPGSRVHRYRQRRRLCATGTLCPERVAGGAGCGGLLGETSRLLQKLQRWRCHPSPLSSAVRPLRGPRHPQRPTLVALERVSGLRPWPLAASLVQHLLPYPAVSLLQGPRSACRALGVPDPGSLLEADSAAGRSGPGGYPSSVRRAIRLFIGSPRYSYG